MMRNKSKKTPCQAAQPSILKLPDELLARILGHLSFKPKVLCQLLSRRFNALLSCPGSDSVWGTIPLAALPRHKLDSNSELSRWLIKRRRGITALTYSRPAYLKSGQISKVYEAQDCAYRDEHSAYALQILPVLAVALPVTVLDLEGDAARRIIATGSMTGQAASQCWVSQYWESLGSCLKSLSLHIPYKMEANADAVSALSQLTALQTLDIKGLKQSMGSLRLSFPQLKRLYLHSVDVPTLVFDCRNLRYIYMEDFCIAKISGLGSSLQKLELDGCSDNTGGRGPLPSFSIKSLVGLESLIISTSQPTPVRDRVLFQGLSCLTQLTLLCLRGTPIESQSLPRALPTSLGTWRWM